jgi:hypothetical protein
MFKGGILKNSILIVLQEIKIGFQNDKEAP